VVLLTVHVSRLFPIALLCRVYPCNAPLEHCGRKCAKQLTASTEERCQAGLNRCSKEERDGEHNSHRLCVYNPELPSGCRRGKSAAGIAQRYSSTFEQRIEIFHGPALRRRQNYRGKGERSVWDEAWWIEPKRPEAL